MTSLDHDKLDALIESALTDEPWRPSPKGLYQRIEASLRVERVRQRMRRRLAMMCAGTVAAAVALVVAGIGFSQSAAMFVPGGMGQIDYVRSAFALSPSIDVMALAIGGTMGAMALTACVGALMAREAQRWRTPA